MRGSAATIRVGSPSRMPPAPPRATPSPTSAAATTARSGSAAAWTSRAYSSGCLVRMSTVCTGRMLSPRRTLASPAALRAALRPSIHACPTCRAEFRSASRETSGEVAGARWTIMRAETAHASSPRRRWRRGAHRPSHHRPVGPTVVRAGRRRHAANAAGRGLGRLRPRLRRDAPQSRWRRSPRRTSPGSPRRGRSKSGRRARSRRRRSSGTARSTAPRPGASSTPWTRGPGASSGGGIRRW